MDSPEQDFGPEATSSESQQRRESLRQNLSDLDQSLADQEQTHSDFDQSSAERDQMASDADQLAADRDQQALPAAETGALADYHVSRVQRLSGTAVRHSTRSDRFSTSTGRDLLAERRDENSVMRDSLADEQDRETMRREADLGRDSEAAREALEQLNQLRTTAATDRAEAAADRERAAGKRHESALKRARALADFQAATTHGPAGVLERGLGDMVLEAAMLKARDSGDPFVLVRIGLDGGPKPPGEERRERAVIAMAEQLRSMLPDGTPIVDMGQNEFVFALTGVETEQVSEKLSEIDSSINGDHQGFRVAMAKVPLGEGDTLPVLIDKASAAYQASRKALHEGD